MRFMPLHTIPPLQLLVMLVAASCMFCVPASAEAASKRGATTCAVGSKAKVLWSGYLYEATLMKRARGKLCIHYDGWSRKWDECVAPSRFQCRGKAAFRTAERVEVKWKGKYWPARIKKRKRGRYCIHYIGYESSWDECVSPKRVRQRP